MGKNSGIMVRIGSGGKAIAYHREQEKAFALAKKHYIHYMTDDFHPLLVDGKPRVGLHNSNDLFIIGYCD